MKNNKFITMYNLMLKVNFSQKQIYKILILYSLNKDKSFNQAIISNCEKIFGNSKHGITSIRYIRNILEMLTVKKDIELFIFGLQLIAIKPYITAQERFEELYDNSVNCKKNTLKEILARISAYNNSLILTSHTAEYFEYLNAEIVRLKIQ